MSMKSVARPKLVGFFSARGQMDLWFTERSEELVVRESGAEWRTTDRPKKEGKCRFPKEWSATIPLREEGKDCENAKLLTTRVIWFAPLRSRRKEKNLKSLYNFRYTVEINYVSNLLNYIDLVYSILDAPRRSYHTQPVNNLSKIVFIIKLFNSG